MPLRVSCSSEAEEELDMIITEEFILRGRVGNGGWNKEQLWLLGVPWPPVSGWMKMLKNVEVSDEAAQKFLAMKGMTIKKARRLKREALQEN